MDAPSQFDWHRMHGGGDSIIIEFKNGHAAAYERLRDLGYDKRAQSYRYDCPTGKVAYALLPLGWRAPLEAKDVFTGAPCTFSPHMAESVRHAVILTPKQSKYMALDSKLREHYLALQNEVGIEAYFSWFLIEKFGRVQTQKNLRKKSTGSEAAVLFDKKTDANIKRLKTFHRDFIFPDGLAIRDVSRGWDAADIRACYSDENKELYRRSTHFLPVEEKQKQDMYALVKQMQEMGSEWKLFEALLSHRQSDIKALSGILKEEPLHERKSGAGYRYG